MGRKLDTKGEYWEFGQRLRIALSRKGWEGDGWTQAKIGAKLCKVSHTTINNWLNGTKLPATHHSIEIGKTLNISLDWLLTGRGEIEASSIQQNVVYIGHMPEEAQDSIKGLVKSFDSNTKKSA